MSVLVNPPYCEITLSICSVVGFGNPVWAVVVVTQSICDSSILSFRIISYLIGFGIGDLPAAPTVGFAAKASLYFLIFPCNKETAVSLAPWSKFLKA